MALKSLKEFLAESDAVANDVMNSHVKSLSDHLKNNGQEFHIKNHSNGSITVRHIRKPVTPENQYSGEVDTGDFIEKLGYTGRTNTMTNKHTKVKYAYHNGKENAHSENRWTFSKL